MEVKTNKHWSFREKLRWRLDPKQAADFLTLAPRATTANAPRMSTFSSAATSAGRSESCGFTRHHAVVVGRRLGLAATVRLSLLAVCSRRGAGHRDGRPGGRPERGHGEGGGQGRGGRGRRRDVCRTRRRRR